MKVDNRKLIELINIMREEKTLQAQNVVISEILKSHFFCPVVIQGAPQGGGTINITKDTQVSFLTIEGTDNKKYLLAFTSEEELLKWKKQDKQQSIIYTFEDYAMIVTNNSNIDGFAIDPYGSNIMFNEEMIKGIKSSITNENVMEKDTEVLLGIPGEYPEDLVKKLKDYFKNINDITKAYLLLMVKDDKKNYLVVIEGNGDVKEYFSSIATAAMPFLDGMPLNLTPYDTDFGRNAIKEIEPFYIKE